MLAQLQHINIINLVVCDFFYPAAFAPIEIYKFVKPFGSYVMK